ncbi:MAG: imelysin family protein, partial [Terrimicrobiaceae bacterium]
RLLAEYPSIPLDSLSLPNSRSLALENLKAETAILRAALKDLLATWSASPADNFRNQVFLADSSGAVGRIFQGLLTVTDLMILEEPSSSDRDRFVSRLEGIKGIYEGSYTPQKSARISGPGLVTVIEQSDPAIAQSLTETLDDLLENWKSEPTGNDESAALLSLKTKLLDAAGILGFSTQTPAEVTP